MIQLNWAICQNNEWCKLKDLRLSSISETLEGIYSIWYWNNQGSAIAVEVGQGYIRNNISNERHKYQNSTQLLYVTWAPLHPDYHDGVEAFLGYALGLDKIRNFPQVQHIEATLPPWV